LQKLHNEQVCMLATENARLRKEVDLLRRGAPAVDFASDEPLGLPTSSWHMPRRVSWSSPPLAATVVASTQVVNQTSNQSSMAASKESAKGLSTDLSRTICSHLKRQRSAIAWMPGVQTVGGLLLDEYSTYRRQHSQQDPMGCLTKLVLSPRFDFFTGAIIMINAVTIGMDASWTRSGRPVPMALQVAECIFLFIYTVEICLRFMALGRRALCNAWVLFDIVLVACGCFDMVTTFLGHSVTILQHVLLVRIFRLARLARVLRLMIKFHTLWMLVHGLLNSLMTLTWTCVIICILLFVFAVLGLELLQPDENASEEYNQVARENFGSLLKAATSLLQGLTLDSFAVIYRPVVLARPLTIFYFVPFLLVVSIALMNLVTALMVNFSLEQAAKDKQAEEEVQTQYKTEVIRILERAFAELDINKSGHVDLQEMLGAPEELRTLICQVADMDSGEDKMVDIFRTLDFDHTGYVKIEDFCQGLLMLHDHNALESYFARKYCANILNMLNFRKSEGGVNGFETPDTLPGEAWEAEEEDPWMPRC